MCFHGLFHVLQFPDYDQCLLGVFQNLGWPSFGFKRKGFQPFEMDMIGKGSGPPISPQFEVDQSLQDDLRALAGWLASALPLQQRLPQIAASGRGDGAGGWLDVVG